MDLETLDDQCRLLWEQLQAADKEWTEAVQDVAELQTSSLRAAAQPLRMGELAAAADARKEKAAKDKDLKYELWRLSDLLDELSRPV